MFADADLSSSSSSVSVRQAALAVIIAVQVGCAALVVHGVVDDPCCFDLVRCGLSILVELVLFDHLLDIGHAFLSNSFLLHQSEELLR